MRTRHAMNGSDMVSIQKGLPTALARPAAELIMSALWEKFVPILGSDDRATDVMAAAIAADRCFSALEDNALVGLLALQTKDHNFLNFGFKVLYDRYGFPGAAVRALALYCLQHHPRPGELYVEGVAVVEAARGKGVGTRLFEALMGFARTRDYDTLSLEVIDTNIRALKLYEQLGFHIKKRVGLWPANKLVGWPFKASILMECAL